jgi:hypothetical protein
MIRGAALAFQVTGDKRWSALLANLMSNLETNLFEGNSVSNIPWVPHWLFNVKAPFTSEAIQYTTQFTFTNGVAHIPAGGTTNGDLVRQVFSANSPGSVLLWQNPYSPLSSGTQYGVASFSVDPVNGTTVTLNSSYTGALNVIYTTLTGPVIAVNQPFEAWPYWRPLATGELNVAVDSMAWAYDAFDAAYAVFGDSSYAIKRDAIGAAVPLVYTVNDGNAWITPTYIDPMGVAGAYTYNQVTPAPTLTRDANGNTVWNVAPYKTTQYPSAVVQYGVGGLNATWNGDTGIQVVFGSNVAATVSLIISSTTSYSAATSYTASVNLTGGGLQTFTLPRTAFLNNSSACPGATDPIASFEMQMAASPSQAYTITLASARPMPVAVMPYMPGAAPFTANFLGAPPELITWRGCLYTGYQAPWIWGTLTGKGTQTANQLAFLAAAQTAYHAQVPSVTGPFAPCYYLPRADSQSFGTANTFGWNGPDPNSQWCGYQYRPFEGTARYWASTPSDTAAAAICNSFLTWLAGAWTGAGGPPTDFVSTGAPQTNYDEPHAAALILRAAMWMDLAGASQTLTRPMILKCITYLQRLYNANAGGAMAGTWCPVGATGWYGFWNGEILAALGLMIQRAAPILSAIGVSQTAILGMVSGNLSFLAESTYVLQGATQSGFYGSVSDATITVAGQFSAVPTADSAWAYGQSAGYQPAKLFRVISIKKSGDFSFDIGAVEYNEEVYTDAIPNYGEIVGVPNSTPAIINLTLTEQFQNGTLTGNASSALIAVGWQNGNTAVGAQVQVKAGSSGTWNNIGNIQGQGCTFVGYIGTSYQVQAIGFDWQGNLLGNPATAAITVTASAAAPANVTGFTGTFTAATPPAIGGKLAFSWNAVPGAVGYEIRSAATNYQLTDWNDANEWMTFTGTSSTTQLVVSPGTGPILFQIKAFGPLSGGSVESISAALWTFPGV